MKLRDFALGFFAALAVLLCVSGTVGPVHAQIMPPGYYSPPPPPPSMVINGGEVCTTQRQVSLSVNFWKDEYSNRYQYRAAESQDNMVRLPFAPMGGQTVPYTLSTGYGRKTVFLDVKTTAGSVISLSDSIDYKQSCIPTSPSFRDLSIRIAKAYPDRYKFDVEYSFKAARFVNDGAYQIEIRIVPDGAPAGTPPIMAPVTLAYDQSQGLQFIQGVEYRAYNGTVSVTAPTQGELPAYGRLRFTIVSKGGPIVPERRISPGDPSPPPRVATASKVILLENHPGISHTYNQGNVCTGLEGAGKRSQGYTVATEQPKWVYGQSSLTLNRASGSTSVVGQNLKFDGNPIPGQGERGVRWTQLPTTESIGAMLGIHYSIYWWCEGLSNKQENQTWEFRYTVKYNYVTVRVE